MNAETRNASLRRLLRRADPALDEAGLTAEESRALRRAVLGAAPEPRRRRLPASAWAGAAMAALAALAILAVWSGRDRQPPAPRETARSTAPAPALPRPPAPAPPAARLAAADDAPAPAATRPRTARTHRATASARRERLAAVRLPQPLPSDGETVRTRQVQFSTPGGTRVIWVLTSNKAL